MTTKDIINDWLAVNPEFRETIADEAGLIETLTRVPMVVRDGRLVDPLTNIVKGTEEFIKANARPFLKVLGTGRYMGRYRDSRSKEQKELNARETREMLKTWVEKRGYSFANDEPLRVWMDFISKNMVFESDDNGGFVLRPLVNGVPTTSHKPEDLFTMVSRYADTEKSRLNELRTKAKLRDEALNLSGLTLADLADKKKAAGFEQTLKLVEKEFFSQPTLRKLPNVERGSLLNDLEKEVAYSWNLPIEPKTWTLQEKTKLNGFAENYVKEVERHAITSFEKFATERPPKFYQQVHEPYSGLPKGDEQ